MSAINYAFQLGAMYGFAIGASLERQERKENKKTILRQEDVLVLDYIKNKSTVYMNDIIGYLGWDDTDGNRRSAGYVMSRLGWERRRGGDGWYYVRGTKAVAFGQSSEIR